MILELSIENYILIEKQNIHFHKGLNIITGETGAGKSIVLGALEAIFGGRVDKSSIKRGKDIAVLQATLDLSSLTALQVKLSEAGIFHEDGLLVVTREIRSEGKNISRINGKIVTQSVIKEMATDFIEITGQHDQQELLETRHQMRLLDDFIGEPAEVLCRELAELCRTLSALKAQLKDTDLTDEEVARRLDLLDYQIEEIEKARLSKGEDDELEERFRLLRHSEKLQGGLQSSLDKLFSEKGAVTLMSSALRDLSSISGFAEDIEKLRMDVESLYYDLDGKHDAFKALLSQFTFSMKETEEIENRLNLINHLKRKYGRELEDIEVYHKNMMVERDNLLSLSAQKEQLQLILDQQLQNYWLKASALKDLRRAQGLLFSEKIEAILHDLNFKNGHFKVSLTDLDTVTPFGSDRIDFLITTNLGEEFKPLAKIASGGELSRIMLAIKTVIGSKDAVPVVIFDEIDTGISGVTATTVGQKIKSISAYSQTLCVTHLPQIAVFSNHHIVVDKKDDADLGTTYATLEVLDFDGQILEISRMAGGDNVTEAAMKNAREMLQKASEYSKS